MGAGAVAGPGGGDAGTLGSTVKVELTVGAGAVGLAAAAIGDSIEAVDARETRVLDERGFATWPLVFARRLRAVPGDGVSATEPGGGGAERRGWGGLPPREAFVDSVVEPALLSSEELVLADLRLVARGMAGGDAADFAGALTTRSPVGAGSGIVASSGTVLRFPTRAAASLGAPVRDLRERVGGFLVTTTFLSGRR